jgi:hypothetical protein
LALAGAYNFRDLGGYPTVDGRVTRWGRLYRSDTLHEPTKADLITLSALGLGSIVDLRTPSEVERMSRGLLEYEPIKYFHLSVIDDHGGESRGIPAPKDGHLSLHYLWYLDIGRDPLVRALPMVGTCPATRWSSTARRERTAPGCSRR